MRMRRITGALALAMGLVLPAPVAAQFDLSGFVGPVTISRYAGCQDFFCLKAAVGVGQNSSGRYFARLLRLDDSFDAAAFDAVGTDRYSGHWVTIAELWYAEPHPTDPEEGEWHFLSDGPPRFTTYDYGTPVTAGSLLVGYTRSQQENFPDGDVITTEWGIRLDVARVTTTPEPMTLALVGTGLVVLLGCVRRRKQS